MDRAISKLVDEISEKPTRSKLEPHAEIIAALRRKRRTYREIVQFFQEHLAITVAPSTIHDFVRVRRRRGKRTAESNEVQPVPSRQVTAASATENDVQQRIAALKQRTPPDQPQPLFTYEEDEPLKLRGKTPPTKVD
jgi:DNA-directed RNA polymerase specialized sigma24 family protein